MTTKQLQSSRTTQIAVSLASLYAILLLLNFKTIMWSFGIIDSPIILAQAILYSPLEYFTDAQKYQFLTYNNFTPWVTLSWDFDYALFQLEPLGYRLHQLASMAVLLGVIYLILLRVTKSTLTTALFCFAIITVPATFGIIDDLVNRHYLEGMIFCLLSFLCVHCYVEKPAAGWLIASVLLYGLSLTAKEIFIPLPGVLFFMFPGGIGKKIVRIIPYAIVLLLGLAWRVHLLSGAGGYSSASDSLQMFGDLGTLALIVTRLFAFLFFHPIVSVTMLALFALLLALNFRQLSMFTKLGVLVGVLGLLLPLIALLPLLAVGFESPRWLFAPSLGLLLFFAYLCTITKSRALVTTIYCLVFAFSVAAAYARTQEETPNYVKGNGKIYKQILESDSESYLRMSRYSQMGAQGQAIWVYIAKLHNGTWGTLQISDFGQLQYHDTANRTAIKVGKKKFPPAPELNAQNSNLDVIQEAVFNPADGALTVKFAAPLQGENCIVYIFGEHNGMLFNATGCKQWSMELRQLRYQLRMTGYNPSDMSIAVWSIDPEHPLYSRPYELRSLIDLDSL